jgi:hypothetical protein
MPTLEYSDDELRAAAQAAHVSARRAQRDASVQPNAKVRETFAASAAGYRRLVETLEEARQASAS